VSTRRFELGEEAARRMDRQDELARFRDEFVIADPNVIYLDGCSLGRLPKRTEDRLRHAVHDEWGGEVIGGWRGAGWAEAPRRIGDKLGKLLGAAAGQVVVTDSTSINLYKLAMVAMAMRPKRTQIVSDEFNFPTDLYVLQGVLGQKGPGYDLHLVGSHDGTHLDTEELCAAIDQRTALFTASVPTFKSCYLYDMPTITQRAHERGALVLWDFCHAAGVVPLELDAWGVDLAVGCSYKYLNGGPGALAWLYVRKELQQQAASPVQGWWSHRQPFQFDLEYVPADGISRYLAGTPPVLSLLPVEEGVDLIAEAGVQRLRSKSVALSEYLIFLTDQILSPLGFVVGSPRDASRRGSHVRLLHPEAYRITEALGKEMNTVVEFRPPDGIRIGLPPLYISFGEVWEAVQRIRQVVQDRRYETYAVSTIATT
jgi:kynureninase